MNIVNWKMAAWSLLLLSVSTALADPPAELRFGEIRYPAVGNIQLDEGTVEVYLRINFSSDQAAGLNSTVGSFFELFCPSTREKAVLTLVTNGSKVCMIGYLLPVNQSWVPNSPKGQAGVNWKKDEDHVVAFTWKGNERQVFVDGVPGPLTKVEGPLTFDLAKSMIRIGAGYSLFSVDALRISNVCRSAQELESAASSEPKADPYTLLLDQFDQQPQVFAGKTEGGERETERVSVIDGRFGKALQLWSVAQP